MLDRFSYKFNKLDQTYIVDFNTKPMLISMEIVYYINPSALGIAVESPQRPDIYRGSEDLQRKARPAGERP